MHDAITIGIPVLVILFGILLNQRGLETLRAEVRADIGSLRNEVHTGFARTDARIDRVQAELARFLRDTGRT